MKEYKFDLERLKADLKIAYKDLKFFFRSPLSAMTLIPVWDWPTTLVVAGAFGALSGVVGAIINHSSMGLLVSIFILPFSTIFFLSVAAIFYHYLLRFAFHKEASIHDLGIMLTLAAMPTFVFQPVARIFPPATLIGIALSFYLFGIALVKAFKSPAARTIQILSAFLVIYIGFWALNTYNIEKGRQHIKKLATPESLDILEQELQE